MRFSKVVLTTAALSKSLAGLANLALVQFSSIHTKDQLVD